MTSILCFILKRKVFANAIMLVLIVGGLMSAKSIRQELYPTQEAKKVEITVALQGATPDEIDKSILQVIENTVMGIEGVKNVAGEAVEGTGRVTLALFENADLQQVYGDITSAIGRIDTFPENAEPAIISIPLQEEKALSLVIYGDQPLLWLRRVAETVRDDLRTGNESNAGLQRVNLAFPRDQEISVEISEDRLRQYNVTLGEVAEKIKATSLELHGGTLFTKDSDISLRTSDMREWAEDYGDVIITSTKSGIPVYLNDIANIQDGFGESTIECWFNGLPAIQLDIFAAGDETPISVEKTVREYIENTAKFKFQGVELVIFENQAAAYRDRVNLLLDNALLGLLLVLIILGLFLTPQVAFWVMVGIPTSLIGSLIFLPLLGGTLNMLSLFAFIVTIGVVVDDAIMVGETIHYYRSKGLQPLDAAVKGVQKIGGVVFLATMTTILAFLPMFFVPGEMGVLFHHIPAVVVAVLLVSLVESIFLLGSHLSAEQSQSSLLLFLSKPQEIVNKRLLWLTDHRIRPFTQKCLQYPAIPLAIAVSFMMITIGGVAGGFLGFSFTPTIASDTVIAQAALPYGTPKKNSVEFTKRLVESANTVLQKYNLTSPGLLSLVGTRLDEGEVEVESLTGSHYISVLVSLPPAKERGISGKEFATKWQQEFGTTGEAETLNFTGETNVTGGEPIILEVFHPEPELAKEAAIALGQRMRLLAGLTSVDDGVRSGKPEMQFQLRDRGIELGITTEALAEQLRHRYHGAEALRFVRDGNEIRIVVRLDWRERSLEGHLDNILLQTSTGKLVPLSEIADIYQTRTTTSMKRRDGKRIFPVTADIGFGVNDDEMEDALEDTFIPLVLKDFPGVSVHFGGEEEENDEALGSLGKGFLVILAIILLLLILQFNSWIEPLVILTTIPFSFIGAVWGHILLGYDLSIVSVIGIIAMAGVVVNDSLVLVTTYTQYSVKGIAKNKAIVNAVCTRFRPILLTSLTTFFGLTPLILESSEQAQFLIPAAVSISFGLLCGSLITLFLVPVLLHVCQQIKGTLREDKKIQAVKSGAMQRENKFLSQ